MRNGPPPDLDWTISTLVLGTAASLVGFVSILGLERAVGVVEPGLERYVLGGLVGALAVVAKHRARPMITILVFMPVLALLLFGATVLFHVYVLGNPIEL